MFFRGYVLSSVKLDIKKEKRLNLSSRCIDLHVGQTLTSWLNPINTFVIDL